MDPLRSVHVHLDKLSSTAPAKQARTLYSEFKAFAFKGNVVDLAVGVIIGAAFGNIVSSLVKNVLMPLVGVILPGDEGFKGWKWVIEGQEIPYGHFLAEVANFLLIALILFLFVRKFLGWVMRTKEADPPALTKDQELLTEIRDLLKKSSMPG